LRSGAGWRRPEAGQFKTPHERYFTKLPTGTGHDFGSDRMLIAACVGAKARGMRPTRTSSSGLDDFQFGDDLSCQFESCLKRRRRADADLRPTTPDPLPMTILSKCPRCCDFPHSADVAAQAPFAPISSTEEVLADEALTLFAK